MIRCYFCCKELTNFITIKFIYVVIFVVNIKINAMNVVFIKGLKIVGLFLLGFLSVILLLIYTGVIWRSPEHYSIAAVKDFKVPVMSMEEYSDRMEHRRPYTFHVKSDKGEAYILGIDHIKDSRDPQIDTINRIWHDFKPDVVLVEGRLGFIFRGIQDPVKVHGEGGKVISLAKRDSVKYYTWEPQKQDEVNMMLKRFTPEKVALFYSLRPYLSNFRFGKPANPDKKLQTYINSRTDYNGIRGEITTVAQVDSIWAADFPQEKDWRDSTDEYGWPKGYLSEMAAYSNELRNIHMCSAILELAEQGKKVLVSMGSSHAFRIEKTLKEEMQRNELSENR